MVPGNDFSSLLSFYLLPFFDLVCSETKNAGFWRLLHCKNLVQLITQIFVECLEETSIKIPCSDLSECRGQRHCSSVSFTSEAFSQTSIGRSRFAFIIFEPVSTSLVSWFSALFTACLFGGLDLVSQGKMPFLFTSKNPKQQLL